MKLNRIHGSTAVDNGYLAHLLRWNSVSTSRVARLAALLTILLASNLTYGMDFNTGLIIGAASSNNSESEEQSRDDAPKDSRTIQYADDGSKSVLVSKVFSSDKWRVDESTKTGFVICTGKYKEYRSISETRCREPAGGLNGFLGGLKDAPENGLSKQLELIEGTEVSLQSIEQKGDNLVVTYRPPEPSESPTVFLEGVTPDGSGSSPDTPVVNDSSDLAIADELTPFENEILQLSESWILRLLGMSLFCISIAIGVIRQNPIAMLPGFVGSITFLAVPSIFRAILVDPAGGAVSNAEGDGYPLLGLFVIAAIPVVALKLYRLWQNRNDRDIDELLMNYRLQEAATAASSAGNEQQGDLGSVDELERRQRERARERASGNVPDERESLIDDLDLQPGRRKVIID